MPIYARKTLLLAKTETTYGQDANPDVSADQIEIFDFSITPNIDKVERNPFRHTLSPVAAIPAKRYTDLSFYVEVKGGGTDSSGDVVEPKVVRLLEACGFSLYYSQEVTDEDVGTGDGSTTTFTLDHSPVVGNSETVYVDGSAQTRNVDYTIDYETGTITFTTAPASGAAITADYRYGSTTSTGSDVGFWLKPTSTNFKSLTFYAYLDGVLYKVYGARGNVQVQLEANNIGKFNFKFTGLFVTPEDAAFPSVSCNTDEIIPPLVKNVNLTMGGYAPILSSFEIDMNNELVQRDDMNSVEGVGGVDIVSRNPSGSLNPDMMLASEYDIWNKFINSTPQEIAGTVGSQTGNKVNIFIPQAVYNSIEIGDRDSVRVFNTNFGTIGCDDELQIEFV